jgi:hypothetical protein
VAEAVQVASRAEPTGDAAELQTSGAVLEAGGRIRCRCNFQDVCCEEQLAAWRVDNIWVCTFHDTLSLAWARRWGIPASPVWLKMKTFKQGWSVSREGDN